MADYAEDAGNGMKTQLAAIYPGLSTAQIAKKIGLTPMIGINDATDERFTVDDCDGARDVGDDEPHRHARHCGRWPADAQCSGTTSYVSTDCSGVTQAPYAFAKALGAFAG